MTDSGATSQSKELNTASTPQIFRSVEDLQKFLDEKRKAGIRIGFVPTMGALHEGHLSLVRRAKEESDCVVCSIFVNPAQFNDAKDFEAYPIMQEADLQQLASVGCDIAFIPPVAEIYPDGPQLLNLDFGSLETGMEGEFRPGHFNGMATVVKRLFDIVQPDAAYFGEKDFQQLAIVRQMVKSLHLKVRIVGCPTLRESDGLAMSSRNLLLNPEQRKAAARIYTALKQAGEHIPHMTPEAVKALVVRYIESNPMLKVQYFELVDPLTLIPIASWEQGSVVQGCIAVLTGGPRLIDNMAYHIGNGGDL